jgi:hypothetical protein
MTKYERIAAERVLDEAEEMAAKAGISVEKWLAERDTPMAKKALELLGSKGESKASTAASQAIEEAAPEATSGVGGDVMEAVKRNSPAAGKQSSTVPPAPSAPAAANPPSEPRLPDSPLSAKDALKYFGGAAAGAGAIGAAGYAGTSGDPTSSSAAPRRLGQPPAKQIGQSDTFGGVVDDALGGIPSAIGGAVGAVKDAVLRPRPDARGAGEYPALPLGQLQNLYRNTAASPRVAAEPVNQAAPPPPPAASPGGAGAAAADSASTSRGAANRKGAKPVDVSGHFAGRWKKLGDDFRAANDPKSLDAALAKAQAFSLELPEAKREEFDRKFAAIDKAKQALVDAYKEDRKQVDWMRVADLVGRAFTQLGASMQGQRTGLALGHVKPEALDLSQNYKAAREDLQLGLDKQDEAGKRLEAEKGRQESLARDAGEFGRRGVLASEGREHEGKLAALNIQKDQLEREMRAAEAAGHDARAAKLQVKLHEIDQAAANYRADLRADSADAKEKGRADKEMVGAQGTADGLLQAMQAGSLKRRTDKEGKQLAQLNKSLELAGWSAKQRADMFTGADADDYQELGQAAAKYIAANRPEGRPALAGNTRPAPGAPGGKQDPQIANYAAQYTGGDYAKAKLILVNRGYQPAE